MASAAIPGRGANSQTELPGQISLNPREQNLQTGLSRNRLFPPFPYKWESQLAGGARNVWLTGLGMQLWAS